MPDIPGAPLAQARSQCHTPLVPNPLEESVIPERPLIALCTAMLGGLLAGCDGDQASECGFAGIYAQDSVVLTYVGRTEDGAPAMLLRAAPAGACRGRDEVYTDAAMLLWQSDQTRIVLTSGNTTVAASELPYASDRHYVWDDEGLQASFDAWLGPTLTATFDASGYQEQLTCQNIDGLVDCE